MFIKFKMYFEEDIDKTTKSENMTLKVDWEDIKMDAATIESYVPLEDESFDDKLIRDFFDWAFDEIIPWVNEYHPESVSKFILPHVYPGIIDIEDLDMEVMDNYIKFGMDPEIMILQGEVDQWVQ